MTLRRIWPLPPLALLIGLTALVASTLSLSSERDITTGLVQLGIVIGLYAFVGVSGVFSFGHVAFVALGAYVSGVFAVPVALKEVLYSGMPEFLAQTSVSPFVSIVIGALVAAAAGALLAPAFGRLAGLSASLATFALLVIVHDIARNLESVTRGTQGLQGVPAETTLWIAVAWSLVILTIAFVFQSSRIGLQLRAAREDPIAAEAMGVFVGRLRGIALVVSAFLVGLSGGVYAQLLSSFNPNVFYLDLTFLTIAMLVVGGIYSLSGAVVGALTLTWLAHFLRDLEASLDRPGLTEVGFALLTIGILILRPSGITGSRELPFPQFLGRRGDQAKEPTSPGGASDARKLSSSVPRDDAP